MGNPWAPPDPSSPPGPVHEHPTPHGPPPHGHVHPAGPSGPPPHGHVPPPAGPQRPPVPAPDPVGVARSSRAAAWSSAALLVSLLLVSAPYPTMLVAPVLAVVGLVLAIQAAVRAARAHARGAVVALPVVLIVASLGWAGLSSQTLLYLDAQRDFAQCQAGALTQQAQRACVEQRDADIEDRLNELLQRVGGGRPTAP